MALSHLCSGAKIGERVTLGQNVYVGGRAVIGSGCKIQNNVSVYDNVILAKNVFCGPSAVLQMLSIQELSEVKTIYQNYSRTRSFFGRKLYYIMVH